MPIAIVKELKGCVKGEQINDLCRLETSWHYKKTENFLFAARRRNTGGGLWLKQKKTAQAIVRFLYYSSF
ncbi:hypothetical protein GC194_10165 [bacterium]|nr:hypothetical protein [bacterium]